MATIKGDGIIIASDFSTTGPVLKEIQINDFSVNEGIATFTLETNVNWNGYYPTFCLFIKTSTTSYLFPAIVTRLSSTDNNCIYAATTSTSSGLTTSTDSLVCNQNTYQYTWALADSTNTDTDLASGNFIVKAYSLLL